MIYYFQPAQIDTFQIIEDLNHWGWKDFKIEMACGFSKGYISQVRRTNLKAMSYGKGVRLYNFWLSEFLGRVGGTPLAAAPPEAIRELLDGQMIFWVDEKLQPGQP